MAIRDLEPALPALKFATLFVCTLIGDLLVEWKVEVKVDAPRDFLPYTRPCSIVGAPTSTGWTMRTSSWLSSQCGGHTG
jgi:hypothetical protein